MDIPTENSNNKSTCRLCDDGNAEIMFSIFDKNNEGQQIIQLIKEYLPIIIYRNDPLSKLICVKCMNTLTAFNLFKKSSVEIAQIHKQALLNENSTNSENIQLFLDCENELKDTNLLVGSNATNSNDDNKNNSNDHKISKDTTTEDLELLCKNCKSTINNPSQINNNKEIELCAELHKAIADSLTQNKTKETEKIKEEVEESTRVSTRRRRSQAFYHELDDSLCSSSLTELTNNTESSQYYEPDHNSDDDDDEDDDDDDNSYDDDEDDDNPVPRKRRRLNNELRKSNNWKLSHVKELFEEDDEICYNPLSLMQLTLNLINTNNLGIDFDRFDMRIVKPKCNYCEEEFKNSKLLALHEIKHISIELGDKIDNPTLWHDSRDDSKVRNEWLNNYQNDDTEDDDYINYYDDNLLIQTGTSNINSENEIKLLLTKPVVNGIALSDYTKDERKAFYKTMRIAGVNKKFCQLCRYSFKDNWAIESHYFSSACYYTCRYCGMRFNKQRHRFDIHVNEHVMNGDQLSTRIYAASKLNNILPRIIQTDKINKFPPPTEYSLNEFESMKSKVKTQKNNFIQRKSLQTIKMEVLESNQQQLNQKPMLSASKSTNQAYFCRKCYKVFYKLDEFNTHSKNCEIKHSPTTTNTNNTSNNSRISNSNRSGGGNSSNSNNSRNSNHINNSKINIPTTSNSNTATTTKNGDVFYSSTGRPMRNCVRDVNTYKDDDYITQQLIQQTQYHHQQQQQQQFLCSICSTPFPTIYSRNSHMRIHKGEITTPNSHNNNYHHNQQQTPQQQHKYLNNHNTKPNLNNTFPKFQNHNNRNNNSIYDNSYNRRSEGHINIKQEPLEPEIQIHEDHANDNYNSSSNDSNHISNHKIMSNLNSIGAVSITPISKNPNQKPIINPNIMKLVESNPHLTIKPQTNNNHNSNNESSSSSSPMMMMGSGNNSNNFSNSNNNMIDDRTYKCSNCWEEFNNKSHLYFHKKNQCSGSKYPCPFCKKRFGTESAYSSHIFYSHPE